MRDTHIRVLADEAATVAFGSELAGELEARGLSHPLVFLRGRLGAGKTTLVRGLLRSLGYSGAVKSPTYTLLEPYDLGDKQVFHFDLYRVQDPLELEFVGFDEILDGPGIKLFEWPENALTWLPQPDVTIELEIVEADDDAAGSVSTGDATPALGRKVRIEFHR